MKVSAVIIGALISFVSGAGGMVLQYALDLGRQKGKIRQDAVRLLYAKQLEFYDKLLAIIPLINEYITTLNVWLGESGPQAQKNVLDNAALTNKFWPLQGLLDAYYAYLPNSIIESANRLLFECGLLAHNPTILRTDEAMDELDLLINVLRECVGIDRISDELLDALKKNRKSAMPPEHK
jgi:hypothetical protein